MHVQALTDQDATHDPILNALERLQQDAQPEDVTLVFLSGHGVKDPQGEYYFLAYDADQDRLKHTAVRGHDLLEYLTSIPGRVLFFVDTCYSGGLRDSRGAKAENSSQVNIDELANELASAPVRPIVFASSTGRQLSRELPEWGHSAFSKALLEALHGQADKLEPKGVIDVTELQDYLPKRVMELTDKQQRPHVFMRKGFSPYAIALVR